jgi:acyl-CoA synthetase (AMP-forming)/AMP-acid ligase II
VKLDETHPAILSFTSGSTGVPKIAVRTHGFLIDQYRALTAHLDFDESHIDLGTLPVFILANLASRLTTLLPDKHYTSAIDARKLAGQMKKAKVSRAICSPALMANLLSHGEFPQLRSVYLGGAPVYPGLLDKIPKNVDLHVVYGSTEAEPISGIRWKDVNSADRQRIAEGAGLPVGHVVPGVQCKIGDGREILVTGKTVLKGYLGGIGDSENKIREGDVVWHRTGDAGYFDESGRLWLLGRVDQAARDNEGTIYPFSVECVLDAVFGIRGAVLIHQGKRAVVIEKNAADPDAVREALKPLGIETIACVQALPMDKRHGAKIDYRRLTKMI